MKTTSRPARKASRAAAVPLLNAKSAAAASLEIAPGRMCEALTFRQVSRYAIAEFIPAAPGEYRPVARIKNATVRVTSVLTEKLGLGSDTSTLRRLIRGGFVEGWHMAPRVYVVDLQSLQAHMERVRKCADEGTDFWTEENLTRFRSAL